MKALLWTSAVVFASVLAGACEKTNGPSPVYAGQWSGVTGQGRPISFVIALNELVTSITLAHDFNGCAATQTFADLQIPIAPDIICIPGPCSPQPSSYRALSFSDARSLDGPSTQIQGVFVSPRRIEGTINFRNFTACGSALAVPWSATRRD